jgi:hypothetical protein
MGVVHIASHAETFAGIDADHTITIGDYERFDDFQISAPPPLPPQARAFEHFYEGLSRAIEDRQLKGINLDENIVHAARVERCKDVLGGREQHALLHQARRIADARDVANVSLNGESVQVCAAKNDAGAGRRWGEPQARTYRGVESDPFSFYSVSNGVLECHLVGQ